MLEPILQQVGAGNPQLAQLIGQNQEQFLQLLAEDLGEEGELPPGAHEIRVTEEERDAIERVRTMPPPNLIRSDTDQDATAVPSWILTGLGHSSLFCLRQERRTSSKLSLRATRRG